MGTEGGIGFRKQGPVSEGGNLHTQHTELGGTKGDFVSTQGMNPETKYAQLLSGVSPDLKNTAAGNFGKLAAAAIEALQKPKS